MKSHFFFPVSDGWAFSNNIDIKQHQSLEDRLSAAQILLQKEPLCPVVVDEMNDLSTIKYGALPERLYVLQAGKVVYKVRSTLMFLCDQIEDFPGKFSSTIHSRLK